MLNFDQYRELATDGAAFKVDPTWGQGRTTFGGLSVALLLENIASSVAQGRVLRSVNANFSAPLMLDTPVEIKKVPLAQGKSLSQVMAQAIQGGRVCTTIVATFGLDKESHVVHPSQKVLVKDREAGKPFPYRKGLTPEFIQHTEMILCEGEYPFSGNSEDRQSGWMRFKSRGPVLDNIHMIALIDVWPPTTLQNYKNPGPSSTANWNVDMIQDTKCQNIGADSWFYYESKVIASGGGYGQTESRISTEDGTLLACSRQVITVYE